MTDFNLPEGWTQDKIDERLEWQARQERQRVKPQGDQFTCKCGTPCFWATGASGKANPLELAPNPNGNIWIDEGGIARYQSKTNPIPDGATVYLSHFAHCQYAKEYRKRHPQ